MKLPDLKCPKAEYRNINGEIRVYCQKLEGICWYQYWKPCKGWFVMSPDAKKCKERED